MVIIPFYQELSVLFWRFLHTNYYFFEEMINHPEFMSKVFLSILFYFYKFKKDPAKSNYLYVCVFILLTLSTSRDMAMKLNDPYEANYPFEIPEFEGGTYADLLYHVIYKMVQLGPRILKPMYKSLISVISNTAPYVKSLTKESSEAVMKLIKIFAKEDYLKENEDNCRVLTNLFEAINYILTYHDEGNEQFLVTLIKYRGVVDIVEKLKISDEIEGE